MHHQSQLLNPGHLVPEPVFSNTASTAILGIQHLSGCSPWGRKESDVNEHAARTHTDVIITVITQSLGYPIFIWNYGMVRNPGWCGDEEKCIRKNITYTNLGNLGISQ